MRDSYSIRKVELDSLLKRISELERERDEAIAARELSDEGYAQLNRVRLENSKEYRARIAELERKLDEIQAKIQRFDCTLRDGKVSCDANAPCWACQIASKNKRIAELERALADATYFD